MLRNHGQAGTQGESITASPPAKVLVVDDLPANIYAMKQVLSQLDAEILTAQSGMETLSIALRHDLSLVLMDVQMPEMDGLETAALLRQNERTRQIPIIFVTALSKEQRYVFKGYEAGAVDYLLKPVEPHILRCKVRAFIELHQQRCELERMYQKLDRSYADMEQFALALRGLVTADQARGGVGLDVGEMSRRIHDLLTTRSAAHRIAGTGARTVRFMERSYDLHHDRHALIEVLLSAFEDVAHMSQRLTMLHTELEREVAVRRQAEHEARTASLAKSRFLACMSHELRTPLNAIIGFSQLIIDEAKQHDTPSMGEDAHHIHNAGVHLLTMINDLLDVSMLEAGKVRVSVDEYQVTELLDEIAATITPLVTRHQNQICLELGQGLGMMRSDRLKLRHILYNLLSNACKFTRGGIIRLAAERTQVNGSDSLVFRVADTGIGIPEDHLESIFEAFVQVDGADSRMHQGAGLGLAITRSFCRLLGGAVAVESVVQRGSTFTVTLPAILDQGLPERLKVSDGWP